MRLSRLLAAGLPVLLAVTACGSATPAAKPAPAAKDAPAGGAAPSATAAAGAAGSQQRAGTAPGAPGSGGSGAPAAPAAPGTAGQAPAGTAKGAPPAAPAPASGGPEMPREATPAELPIDGKVTPGCVLRGETARLDVLTNKGAMVGYVAIYAGNKSGAVPPYGSGHGGNDHGRANSEGEWSNTWVVGLDAPTGPAKVVIAVATKGVHRQVEVPFSVGAREAGGCGV